MDAERKGRCAPAPWMMSLKGGDILSLLFESRERAEKRKYNRRPDNWGRGMIRDLILPGLGPIEDDVAPIFVGLVGEYALRCYLTSRGLPCEVDFSLYQYGDAGKDFYILNTSIEVKTRRSRGDHNLVRAIDEYGNPLTFKANAIVFSWYDRLQSSVSIMGWMKKDDLLKHPISDARRGCHKNYSVSDDALDPLSRLCQYVACRRQYQENFAWHS